MHTKFTSRYKVWLTQSHFDLKAAQDSLNNCNYEWSCYQSVQAVEKSFKGILIHSGVNTPQTHKLGVLLSLCNEANKNFIKVKFDFRKIEAYTFISRYPFVYPGQNQSPHDSISKEDALTCLNLSKTICQKIIEFLNNNPEKGSDTIDLEHYYYTSIEISSRIDDVIEKLKEDQLLNVNRIILFGSFAREVNPPKTSTMDLLIIANSNMSFIKRMEYVRDLTKGGVPIIEPLIYTSEEFEYMLKEEGEGYIEDAIDEGKSIYTKY